MELVATFSRSVLFYSTAPWYVCCLVYDSTWRAFCGHNVPTCVEPQLQRHNFCSRWTSLVELSSGPAAQSRHHLLTVQTTADMKGHLFFGKQEHSAATSDMQRLRQTLSYIHTYLPTYFSRTISYPSRDSIDQHLRI